MEKLFSEDFDINKILQGLKLESGVNIEPQNTLIILDEIQENLKALKYFCESANLLYRRNARSSKHIYTKWQFARNKRNTKNLLDAYEQDFSKHAPSNIAPRIRQLWNNIPTQLAKENKKFIYGLVRQGARERE